MNDLPLGLSPVEAPLPPGLAPIAAEAPPLPAGLSLGNPLAPDKTPEPEKTNAEIPSFWNKIAQNLGGNDPLAQQFVGALTQPYQNLPGTALVKGLSSRVEADVAGAQAIAPVKSGGSTLEDLYQKSKQDQEAQDEIDKLLVQKVDVGWSNPKWWGTQIAHGTGSMIPGIGAATVGATGGVPGMLAGFGGEGALGTIVPAYKAARAAGLSPDDATTRALVDSGVAGSVAVAMGLAPGLKLFGQVQNPAVTDQVAMMLKRPVMETLAQLGLVQPGLAVAGELTKALTHGETPDPWDLATTYAVGLGMGVGPVGVHAALRASHKAGEAAIPADPLASQTTIDASFANQNRAPPEIAQGTVPPFIPEGLTEKPSVIRPNESPAVPVEGPPPTDGLQRNSQGQSLLDLQVEMQNAMRNSGPGSPEVEAVQQKIESFQPEGRTAFEQDVYPREHAIFFSPVRRAIEERLPESASVEQTIATLKNAPGVKEEELFELGLPNYLASVDGKVNKQDLIAHVEANATILEEVQKGGSTPEGKEFQRYSQQLTDIYGSLEKAFQDASYPEMNKYDALHARMVDAEVERGSRAEFPNQVLTAPRTNYREFLLKVPEAPIDPIVLEKEAKASYDHVYGDMVKSGHLPSWEMQSPNIRDIYLFNAKDRLAGDRRGVFQDTHWLDDKNVIAHFRVTDRVDRDGRHVLHVEEIQSQLHQTGHKIGYRDRHVPDIEELRKERRALNREADALIQKYPKEMNASTDAWAQMWKDGTVPPEIASYMERRKLHTKNFEQAATNSDRQPDLPFKTSWQELSIKRILRLAADEGYDRITFANGDQVGLRLGSAEEVKGARKNYDQVIPSIIKRWAKKLGMDVGYTKIVEGKELSDLLDPHWNTAPTVRRNRLEMLREMGIPEKPNDLNVFIDVNPAAGTKIRQGLPLYDEPVGGKRTLSEAVQRGLPKELVEPGKKIIQIFGQLGREIKLGRPLKIQVEPVRGLWRGKTKIEKGEYVIRVNTANLRTAEDLYATLGHEFGHVVMWDKFAIAPDQLKTQIFETFKRFKLDMNQNAKTVGDVRRVRDNAVSEMTGGRNSITRGERQNDIPLSDLQPRSRAYMLHFEEWFAEQVSKWATTSERPLSRVDRFFADLGKTIRSLVEKFQSVRGQPASAEKIMQDWLDSMISDVDPFAADIKDKMEFDARRKNAAALDKDGTPEVPTSPITASTAGGRNIIDNLPPGMAGSAGPASAAHADRMNKFFEWMTSLPQIAEMNKHIRGLTMYKEIVATMNIEKNNIMGAAWETLRKWKAIRDPKQQFALNKFIEDYMNGMFKDPSDMSGEIRRPTKDEFTALAKKHGLSDQSLKMFDTLARDFDSFLEGYRALLKGDAARIKDPLAQKKAMEEIDKRVNELLTRPYFPAMRFGKYTVTVYDSKGNVRHFEQTESLRKQRKIVATLEKSSDLLPGDWVRPGEVPKDAAPLLGMPPGLLDLLESKLDLSSTQRSMLDQLRFDYAPSQSFRHQFKTKDLTPGYSTDFQRAYANFFFHGANHFTRVKWVDALRDQMREIKEEGLLEKNKDNAKKRDQLSNYLQEHFKMLVDPKPDFAALRGLMFHWYLGFNPASATLNLSQTPLMTYPHLASKFGGLGKGDAKAMYALMKASTDLNNFYKKGTLVDIGKNAPSGPAGSGQRALAEAVKEGVISETQAHTLAAVSENRNLLRAFGSKAEERWQNFSEASSWMFEMTEQYNRRVAFRAAWDLAMRDPNNKYVSETIRDNPLQYERLKKQGWTHQEAAAFTAAKHSTEATQFVYAPYARPKLMWGRRGALFIFKSFVQNTLFNLYNNPAGAARTLLILGAVGGMMGLPGMEDLNGILKGIAWKLFHKDFDIEDEARKFAVDVLHGAIGPDMLLHGMSTKGFGIPAVLNTLGAQVGLPKFFPTLDRHGSIGMGNILPFEPGKLFGPAKDVKGNELAQIQRASGAGFSLGFALYNFLSSQDSLKELKTWEPVIPRVAGNLSHAFRYFNEGKEKNKSGSAVVRFDPNDTEQMAEILARAAGYQPRRLTAQYESIQAKQEQATYWDLRKQILLRQFATALKGGNPEEKAGVVQAIKGYNSELPQEAKAKAITSATLRDSVQNRLRTQSKQEAGLPTSKQNYGIFKEMDKYFPEARPTGQVDARPVK